MQASVPCPKCKKFQLYRSHSKNVFERAVKKLLPCKIYRCHECKWRGWIMKKHIHKKEMNKKELAYYIIVFLILIFTVFMLRNIL